MAMVLCAIDGFCMLLKIGSLCQVSGHTAAAVVVNHQQNVMSFGRKSIYLMTYAHLTTLSISLHPPTTC